MRRVLRTTTAPRRGSVRRMRSGLAWARSVSPRAAPGLRGVRHRTEQPLLPAGGGEARLGAAAQFPGQRQDRPTVPRRAGVAAAQRRHQQVAAAEHVQRQVAAVVVVAVEAAPLLLPVQRHVGRVDVQDETLRPPRPRLDELREQLQRSPVLCHTKKSVSVDFITPFQIKPLRKRDVAGHRVYQLPRHTSVKATEQPPRAKCGVANVPAILYFRVSFAGFPRGNAYRSRHHSHRTVEAGRHLGQSGPSYGALTVRGISGAYQPPAPRTAPTRPRSRAPYGARSSLPTTHATGMSPPPTWAPQSHRNRRCWGD